MSLNGILKAVSICLALGLLAGCDSAKERAASHYQNAMKLLEQGDTDRAMVELRNVLALDAGNRKAREEYAKLAREKGNISESYSNYLALAERYPDDAEAQLALTQMAIAAQNWDEAERHGKALAALNQNLPGEAAVQLTLNFRQAVLDKDNAKIRDLTRQAQDLAKANPDDLFLKRIIIDGLTRDNQLDQALAVIDDAIRLSPDDKRFYLLKAALFGRLGETDKLEQQLRDTVAKFPDDDSLKAELVRMLAARGKIDEAETFLRAQVGTGDGAVGREVALVAFIRQARSQQAALDELNAAIPKFNNDVQLRGLKAGILFDLGQRDEAIKVMNAAATEGAPSAQQDKLKVALAKMLGSTGNEVGARKIVGEVLAHDAKQTDALKMQAAWMIRDDKADTAISELRIVLDQSPNDAEAMTLMAEAHQRNGETELAKDLLSLAVEASHNGANESLRYARVLMADKRYQSAEDVLINALKVSPNDLRLMRLLGDLYVAEQDWPRASQVETSLRNHEGSDAKQAVAAADSLRLRILSQRDGQGPAIAYLENLAKQDTTANAAKIALIRARLQEGKADEALSIANDLVASNPDNPRAELVLGGTQLAARDFASAADTFRGVAEKTPTDQQAWAQLVRALGADGKIDEAKKALDEGLAANPDSPDLLWAKATFLERANDIDGAIKIYDALYQKNSNSPILANNLASLLSTYRQDDASLERAYAVARRLRGTTIPPFQDTYGWILFRRGDVQEALTYLVPAAQKLSNDPIVQYHLAKAYLAQGQKADALAAFKRADQIAGQSDTRSQIVEARAEIKTLAAELGTE